MNAKQVFRAQLSRSPLSMDAAELICARLNALDAWREAKRAFIYVSVPPEPDTLRLIASALAQGVQVAVPKVCPKGIMRALIINDLNALRPGIFNIPQPPDSSEEMLKPDIAVIPCLACGKDGSRIGHGGGYYDRYLKRAVCFSVCLCPDALLFDSVPMDEYDVRPDAIITETATIMINKGVQYENFA